MPPTAAKPPQFGQPGSRDDLSATNGSQDVTKRLLAHRLLPAAIAAWLIVALVAAASVRNDRVPGDSIFEIYRSAAVRWQQGEPLYDDTGHGFIYLPSSAVAVIPFACLPYPLAGLAWRLVNLGVFVWGSLALSRQLSATRWRAAFFLTTIPSALMCVTCARHGQMTLIMGGLMLLTVSALARRAFWTAAAAIAVAVALKPLAVVLLLLVLVLYPGQMLRWTVCLGLVGLAPFLCQRPEYVAEQYRDCLQMFAAAAHEGALHEFANIFWGLKSAGIDLSESTQRMISLAGGLGTLLACLAAKRRLGAPAFAAVLVTLAVSCLLLLSPRTERNTYALLGPCLGIFAWQCFAIGRRRSMHALILLAVCFETSHSLGMLLTGRSTPWMKPLLALSFVVLYLVVLFRAFRGSTSLLEAAAEPGPQTARPSLTENRSVESPTGPSRKAA